MRTLRLCHCLKYQAKSLHEAVGIVRDGPAIFLRRACRTMSTSPFDLLDKKALILASPISTS